MNPNLPLWVNALLEILGVGEDHCGCEICKELKRGKFKTK